MKINIKIHCLVALFTILSAMVWAQGQMNPYATSLQADNGTSHFFMTNPMARNITMLDGKWDAIVDPVDFGIGSWAAIWKDKKATAKDDFYEYSFEGGLQLYVPGDFNTQLSQLEYLEGTVWYKKKISYNLAPGRRAFLYVGAANYLSNVWLNGRQLGSHEGGFTPFQFEITDQLRQGENTFIIRVNNERRVDGIPARGYDWVNYGGLTRSLYIIETAETYVNDYSIHLDRNDFKRISGWVSVNGKHSVGSKVRVSIPSLGINSIFSTDSTGRAVFSFKAKGLSLWSPESPVLYDCTVSIAGDTVSERIGFRDIRVDGDRIMLNGKPVFLRGICFHEESPFTGSRLTSEADARMLLGWCKELGCNFIRLAHYPHNEFTVRLAEEMGFMLWSEIPVYQGVNFGSKTIVGKMKDMLYEMISRDRNRCGIVAWGIANETRPGGARDRVLGEMADYARQCDPTRLITAALNNWRINSTENSAALSDKLIEKLDIIALNAYIGWYNKWPSEPGTLRWNIPYDKPVIFSEFGAEALYNQHDNPDRASSWSEEYQAKVYSDNIKMFEDIEQLSGVCPWILTDFRSPRRLLPRLQDGWNRKGLLSDKGQKKKAWYVMKDYYANKIKEEKNEYNRNIERKTP